jgi:hypothetical protein
MKKWRITSNVRALSAVITLLAATWVFSTGCLSDDLDSLTQFYKGREAVFRTQYNEAMKAVEAEAVRKAKAGEPAATSKESTQGLSAIRFLFYNQAAFQVLCAEQLETSKSFDDASKAVHACIDAKADQLTKYLKLEEYMGTLGDDKFIKCQIKARDYKNETRFPPYDFLRDPTGPKLLDFAALNECIMSGL